MGVAGGNSKGGPKQALPREPGPAQALLASGPRTAEVSWRYGRLHRYLKENGLLIAANDLWIAATALAFDMPVVTRNEKRFRRVPELEVLGYC